jgi:hypothetical protein
MKVDLTISAVFISISKRLEDLARKIIKKRIL